MGILIVKGVKIYPPNVIFIGTFNLQWQIHFFIKLSLGYEKQFLYVSKYQQATKRCQLAIWKFVMMLQNKVLVYLC